MIQFNFYELSNFVKVYIFAKILFLLGTGTLELNLCQWWVSGLVMLFVLNVFGKKATP